MSTWTTLQIANVVRLWNDGYAASQIAFKIDRSRNAVIGVVHRQKLASRKTQVRAKPAPQTEDEKIIRSKKRTATLALRRKAFLNASLLDLEPHHCRYPQGDGPFLFCGDLIQRDSSYCPEHHRLCYGRPAATPEQIDRARKARVAKNRVYGAAV